jgi:hypothetical protein
MFGCDNVFFFRFMKRHKVVKTSSENSLDGKLEENFSGSQTRKPEKERTKS